ncbi:helix-turn-helix domain-containing protein [Micromonospora purpureochromogenes]|uniref:helix-turn-helix domain-containing protein n=1 Tax=Micromonospora purpureochromogenes TaxID=47872 RepID=UPI00341041CB
MEAVARDAGVGIDTLYRHFPPREALVEAVYRSEPAKLCDAAEPGQRDLAGRLLDLLMDGLRPRLPG